LRPGRPEAWRHPDEQTGQWTTEERERVFDALADTPSILKDPNIFGFYRLKESSPPGNPASNNFADFVLYDSAFDEKHNLTHVISHELAHRLFEKLARGDQGDFASTAEWGALNGPNKPGRTEDKFMRKNGMLSVREDFADDITAFVYEPKVLKLRAPKVYKWIEDHFGNKLRKRGK
jgi:hypothetical protein